MAPISAKPYDWPNWFGGANSDSLCISMHFVWTFQWFSNVSKDKLPHERYIPVSSAYTEVVKPFEVFMFMCIDVRPLYEYRSHDRVQMDGPFFFECGADYIAIVIEKVFNPLDGHYTDKGFCMPRKNYRSIYVSPHSNQCIDAIRTSTPAQAVLAWTTTLLEKSQWKEYLNYLAVLQQQRYNEREAKRKADEKARKHADANKRWLAKAQAALEKDQNLDAESAKEFRTGLQNAMEEVEEAKASQWEELRNDRLRRRQEQGLPFYDEGGTGDQNPDQLTFGQAQVRIPNPDATLSQAELKVLDAYEELWEISLFDHRQGTSGGLSHSKEEPETRMMIDYLEKVIESGSISPDKLKARYNAWQHKHGIIDQPPIDNSHANAPIDYAGNLITPPTYVEVATSDDIIPNLEEREELIKAYEGNTFTNRLAGEGNPDVYYPHDDQFDQDPFANEFLEVEKLSITLKNDTKKSHAEVYKGQALFWNPPANVKLEKGEIYEACATSSHDDFIALHIAIVHAFEHEWDEVIKKQEDAAKKPP